MSEDRATLESTYNHLLTLWTSGVRDYHTMLSDYLTANSIFVAVIALLVSRESLRETADAIAGARLEVIEQAGHMAHLEQSERFNTLLTDFAKGLA